VCAEAPTIDPLRRFTPGLDPGEAMTVRSPGRIAPFQCPQGSKACPPPDAKGFGEDAADLPAALVYYKQATHSTIWVRERRWHRGAQAARDAAKRDITYVYLDPELFPRGAHDNRRI